VLFYDALIADAERRLHQTAGTSNSLKP